MKKHVYKLLLDFFDGDKEKVLAWFYARNPLLGGTAPFRMILLGREAKLEKFIVNQLSENRPKFNGKL